MEQRERGFELGGVLSRSGEQKASKRGGGGI